MLFSKETYVERRRKLRELVGSGLILLFGNNDSPNNYPSNVYKFRQDSAFLYFFGQHRDGLVGVIDADSGNEFWWAMTLTLKILCGTVQSPRLLKWLKSVAPKPLPQ